MIPDLCEVVEPCCERSYLICSDVANAVATALRACIGPDDCEDLDVFVSHHEPIGSGYYVAAWLVRERYTGRLAVPIPTISVRFVEPGFPRPDTKGGRLTMPGASRLDGAARHSYGHGDIMVDAIRAGVPLSGTHWRGCRTISDISRVPDRIQAGWSGWTVTATWDL